MTDADRPLTVAQARRAAGGRLRAAGLDSPELDARLLVGAALALDHTGLAQQSERALSEAEQAALEALIARRTTGEPVARILGHKEFWGLTLHLNAATLVPRPQTETVVEAALQALDRDGPRTRKLHIADLGTGSGALLLALLSELPGACGLGTDLDPEALCAAAQNAQRLGLGDRARFVRASFEETLGPRFDLVVSNPPYIATAEIAALPAEVRRDPLLALDGGADGLDAYRTIARTAPALLKPGGHLVLELGFGQEAAVAALLRQAGLTPGPARPDLAGIARALPARRGKSTA